MKKHFVPAGAPGALGWVVDDSVVEPLSDLLVHYYRSPYTGRVVRLVLNHGVLRHMEEAAQHSSGHVATVDALADLTIVVPLAQIG